MVAIKSYPDKGLQRLLPELRVLFASTKSTRSQNLKASQKLKVFFNFSCFFFCNYSQIICTWHFTSSTQKEFFKKPKISNDKNIGKANSRKAVFYCFQTLSVATANSIIVLWGIKVEGYIRIVLFSFVAKK